MTTYREKLLDPRWQRKRLEILQRDEFGCQECGDSETTLHVHHRYYESGKDPWDYPDEALETICARCHEQETFGRENADKLIIKAMRKHFNNDDIAIIAKALLAIERMPHIPNACACAIAELLTRDGIAASVESYFDGMRGSNDG